MTLRIDEFTEGSETIFTLIGRITSPDVQQLKAEIAEAGNRVTLDFERRSSKCSATATSTSTGAPW